MRRNWDCFGTDVTLSMGYNDYAGRAMRSEPLLLVEVFFVPEIMNNLIKQIEASGYYNPWPFFMPIFRREIMVFSKVVFIRGP